MAMGKGKESKSRVECLNSHGIYTSRTLEGREKPRVIAAVSTHTSGRVSQEIRGISWKPEVNKLEVCDPIMELGTVLKVRSCIQLKIQCKGLFHDDMNS